MKLAERMSPTDTGPRFRKAACAAFSASSTARTQGGGRFDGHPTAALLAGAACVLSSAHPLFDCYAAEFSDKLYAKALDHQTPLPLGAALLQARQEMAQEYADNPLVWAMTVLWGNPWARLV